jgi:hypothetical protein
MSSPEPVIYSHSFTLLPDEPIVSGTVNAVKLVWQADGSIRRYRLTERRWPQEWEPMEMWPTDGTTADATRLAHRTGA